jgi:hypothetical protein
MKAFKDGCALLKESLTPRNRCNNTIHECSDFESVSEDLDLQAYRIPECLSGEEAPHGLPPCGRSIIWKSLEFGQTNVMDRTYPLCWITSARHSRQHPTLQNKERLAISKPKAGICSSRFQASLLHNQRRASILLFSPIHVKEKEAVEFAQSSTVGGACEEGSSKLSKTCCHEVS